jgi:hypothetical protein
MYGRSCYASLIYCVMITSLNISGASLRREASPEGEFSPAICDLQQEMFEFLNSCELFHCVVLADTKPDVQQPNVKSFSE